MQDGIIPRSPCSRKTSPGAGSQRPYVATTEQVCALNDAMPENLRPAILLGAFAGLRTSETYALRIAEVDFMRGIVSPSIQWPSNLLKSETSRTPVPIPRLLALELSAAVKRWQGVMVVADDMGRLCSPWELQRAMQTARAKVDGLPEGFRYHDLRHASAMTTLNTYGHMWPDADESTRVAIAGVLAARAKVKSLRS